MKAEKITKEEFIKIKSDNCCIFDTADFCELNRYKVDEIDYLLIKNGDSPRFTVAVGRKDKKALLPFSAPYSMINPLKKQNSVARYHEAVSALDEYFVSVGVNSARFILPPLIYDPERISKMINALFVAGYNNTSFDLNYYIDLGFAKENDYMSKMDYSARKNLRISLNSGLELYECSVRDEIADAYDVIAQNRESKGYPLRMTKQQVLDTLPLVKHDVFIVKKDNNPIAAAFVYRPAAHIAQVIYWGDIPGNTMYKPINFLSYSLVMKYKTEGMKILDIGTSTENSMPNFGLCDFKESIGCDICPKYIYERTF